MATFAALAFSPVGEKYLSAQEVSARRGLPPLKITKIRAIQTRPNAGWTIVKVETSEPGLYGIGSAGDFFSPRHDSPGGRSAGTGSARPRP